MRKKIEDDATRRVEERCHQHVERQGRIDAFNAALQLCKDGDLTKIIATANAIKAFVDGVTVQ